MALSDKAKRVNLIFTDKRFEDPAVAMDFRGRLLNDGLPSVDTVTYAFIMHDLDVVEKDRFDADGSLLARKGSPKTPHFHCWIECKSSRRLGTYISKLAQAMDFDPQLISCEKAVSMEGSIQYMIHKNDPDKHQYNIGEILTNIEKDELYLIMDRPAVAFSVDFIMNAWASARDIPEFVKTIGLERFNTYFKTINYLTGGLRK